LAVLFRAFILAGVVLWSGAVVADRDAGAAKPLAEAILAKPAGPSALGIAANLIEHEAFDHDRPAEMMPALIDGLRHPAETALGGFEFSAATIERLGVTDMPNRLARWGGGGFGSLAVEPTQAIDIRAIDTRAIETYLGEVRALLATLPPAVESHDTAGILDDLGVGGPGADTLARLGGATTGAAARRIAPAFIAAVSTLVDRLAGIDPTAFLLPETLDMPEGRVLIGTAGNDHYRIGPEVVLVFDPGGDDDYDLDDAVVERQVTIVDLKGNDHYRGNGLAIRSLSVLVDLDGDDRYEGGIGAQAATLGGVALLIDRAGNDSYKAGAFAQAAAAEGVGVLIDGGGDDSYELDNLGQGLGQVGGIGLLWDLGGNDRYTAAGPPDTVGRDARLSQAQGMGVGLRASHAGGLGILIDDAGDDTYGDDTYKVEMFGQGAGYFHGIGILVLQPGLFEKVNDINSLRKRTKLRSFY